MSKTKPTQPPTSPPAETDLPEGWATARLPDVADIIMGQSPPGSTYNEDGDGLPFFQGKAEFGERHPTVRKWCSAPNKIAEAGDILISIRAPVGPTNVADRTCAIGRGLAAIRPLGGIPRDLLLHALRLQEDELASQGTGSTFTAINRDNLDAVELFVPPLPEQKRIVAKVEALLERVNAARARLARLPAILKRFRQSVLAAACSGQLTAEWREHHSTAQPPANRESKGVRDVDLSELPREVEIAGPWEWRPVGAYLEDARYGTSIKCGYEPNGVPVLRVPNIASGKLDLGDLKYGPLSPRERESLLLREGDVVICRTNGSLELVGKAAVFTGVTGDYAFASYLIRLRSDASAMLPAYLHLFLSSPLGRDQIEQTARTTAGQFNLNLDLLRNLLLPLPPLEEQLEIVRRVEGLFALADRIEANVRAATVRAERMPQAILARAFRGELVPTEAELAAKEARDYEPAERLLARIREEAAQRTPERKKRSRTATGKKAMKKIDKASVLEAIAGMPSESFAFDELRAKVPGNYDGLKDILFSLLDDPQSGIVQVFDKQAKAMRFRRRAKP